MQPWAVFHVSNCFRSSVVVIRCRKSAVRIPEQLSVVNAVSNRPNWFHANKLINTCTKNAHTLLRNAKLQFFFCISYVSCVSRYSLYVRYSKLTTNLTARQIWRAFPCSKTENKALALVGHGIRQFRPSWQHRSVQIIWS